MDKPTCPDHPKSQVSDARLPGTDKRTWICLTCGKGLGDAPPRGPEWELFGIKGPNCG